MEAVLYCFGHWRPKRGYPWQPNPRRYLSGTPETNGSAKSDFLHLLLCFARDVKLQAPGIRTVVVQPQLNFYFGHVAILQIVTVFRRDRIIHVFTVSADVRHGVLQGRIAGNPNLSTSAVTVNLRNLLFVNTAETFRVAKWYRKDDSELLLKIVPLTLRQVANLFKAPTAAKGALDPKSIGDLLRDCLAELNSTAPAWKSAINERVDRFVTGRLSA
jgi:hypothetical protein